MLERGEKLNVEVKNGGTAHTYALIWLADGAITPVKGSIFTVKATGSTTLTANAWTPVPITFDQDLPAGRYAVVGFRAKSANIIGARLIFVGGTWRPGVIGVRSYNVDYDNVFRYGNFGVFGEFEFDQPPQVEVLADTADTSEEFWFDLIQVRAGR